MKQGDSEEPDSATPGEVTALLVDWNGHGERGQERLMALIYPELRRLAAGRMRKEREDHTLQPTALVNEVFLRLVDNKQVTWRNRAHFLAVASSLMRRILVDHARAHNAGKRGGSTPKVSFDDADPGGPDRFFDVLEIHDLVDQLSQEDERLGRIVELRFFGGLTFEEAGEVLGINERTVKRDWQVARAWLFNRMNREKPDGRGLGSD